MIKQINKDWEITKPLLVFSAVSLLFLLLRIIFSDSFRYWFLSWNLILAWIPIIAAILLIRVLRSYRWASWQAILLSVIWLFFLPNSFYLITDFIHLKTTQEISLLFDVVLLGAFSFSGFFLGFVSLALIHSEFNKRFRSKLSNQLVLIIIFLASFAIYLGRYLRWNSWDIVVNPTGIIYDVVDRVASPSDYPVTFITTLMFFIIISTFYFCTRWLIKLSSEVIK